MTVSGLLVIVLGYLAALIGFAAWVERQRDQLAGPRYRRPAYILALTVYCTSWTFFGAVGSAATNGWSFLPITLGPILVWLLMPWLVPRLIEAVQRNGATSISDFIGGRFNKSRSVAATVTLLALLGTIPYLALQLRSVGTTFVELAGGSRLLPIAATAVLLAAFAILFGTRRYSVSGRNEAVIYTVAVEAVLKLAALVAVALFAVTQFLDAPADVQAAGLARLSTQFKIHGLGGEFIVITLLSMAAIVCLPRQFYIGVIAAASPADAHAARWPVIAYLLVTTLAIVPITLAGLAVLPAGSAPDLFVLDLPLAAGANGLAVIVFLGGFSAATGMAVVETIALSTMISNDLVGPVLLPRLSQHSDVAGTMLLVRRLTIVAVMGAALGYALVVPSGSRLADIGLVAFAAMGQFAPALLLALRDRTGDPRAAMAGLGTGLLLWTLLLLLPTLGWRLGGWLNEPDLARAVLISIGGNLVAYALVAARRLRTVPADTFAGEAAARLVTIGALADLAVRFAGDAAVADALGFARDRNSPVERRDARTIERLIAAVVGAPSARIIMASALSGTALRVNDVAQMLDDSGQSLQFSKGLLAATLENIDPGVSVVDRDLRLVAWNSRYLDLFDYPAGMINVGTPVADLIRFNALRGECGPGQIEDHVSRRLDHMRRARQHRFERVRPDGRVIKTVGGPMTGGGYVMCFTDITAEARARAALEMTLSELETRVTERTAQLLTANAALGRATADKTRFLAAASHDLLQPLHAARLFAGALGGSVPSHARPLLDNVDRSIASADQLLRALLDISKLDVGGVTPQCSHFSARALLVELVESFAPLAAEKGLRLNLGRGDAWLMTDRNLLRSIIQNFISNAIRYTLIGGVVVGVRRHSGAARIEVRDTGLGIAVVDQQRIFREFERLGHGSEVGLGLGLSIAQRTAALIEAPIDLWSVPGRGSRFAVSLPRVARGHDASAAVPSKRSARLTPASLIGLSILVVDDDAAIREGSAALLTFWGCRPVVTDSITHAIAEAAGADVALVDLDLCSDLDGIDLILRLRERKSGMACALVTADRTVDTIARCATHGITLVAKPIEPALLALWLASAAKAAAAQ